jgi:glycyl-tRNA synthetase beta subunit
LAFGTSSGIIAVFNAQQHTFCQQLGDKRLLEEFGAVCCIDFDRSQEQIIAGYEKGDLILWDIQNQQ